ncbi:efflux RND transporter periplasmic adaptor subunit [Acidisoma cellulosilytica]|uniref:Efflux RND transporter periplasmic adaptor subunit n=1 Tax=Acidisoma cellulosilyticum TaxID=2802395 RepID=A0A964E1R0_9PROT|nr:efflux RND transporter periplasmic adaptor subunit [Acidisoma cellulosilyticum]MCB8878790.1 efflux RND transporter periplasmic adaptor subunit [Acidisoma cellulosilyticum]
MNGMIRGYDGCLTALGMALTLTLPLTLTGGLMSSAQAAAPAAAPVPVTVTKAVAQNVPVYFDGLGNVQAYNTVSIKAQVGGVLIDLPAKEGQEVKKGDILARIDPSAYQATLDQALAQRAEDLASLQSAQLDLARYAKLATSSYAPVQQVDDQRAVVGKDQAIIQADNAMIETAKINLGYATIHAPFDGRVGLYQIDVGNLIQANGTSPILTVTQDKPIAVVFTLPEDQLPQVQDARAKGPLAVLVTDKDSGAAIATGTLLTPDNTISMTTGTISLKARFANDDDHLWPGQFVNTRLQVKMLQNAVTIPSIAVQHGPDGLFVFLVKPDTSVAQTPVTVSYQDSGMSVIGKGVAAGDDIVVSGQSRLSPGIKVQGKTVDAAKIEASGATDDGGAPG